MELSISTVAGITRVQLTGDVDERGSEQLKSTLMGLPFDGMKTLTFDFQKVSHIGSAGLGKLLLCYKRLSSKGITMRVENLSSELRELFAELRLDSLFSLS